ncbi:MAG: hypothetical protein J6S67_11600 [Methanobrevibacter sp.]|nr:hypothetical protein [Methanobrevibacter sp.]
MKNYKEMTFSEIIEDVRLDMGLNDYRLASVYARHDILEIFVIRCPDEFYDWYHFYCLHSITKEPVCFSAVTSSKDAERIFKALTGRRSK